MADIGGTHARIGLIDRSAQGSAIDGPFALSAQRKFLCADYSSLSAIIDDFLRSIGSISIDAASLACAGYPRGDELVNANLAWPVSVSALRSDLGLRDVRVINDFTAIAYAAHFHDDENSALIAGEGPMRRDWPILVIGPGTGLGAALLLPGESRPRVLATEVGHAALAARTDLEWQIVRRLGNGSAHVENERVFSGPGLFGLYTALCAIRGTPASLETPAQISAAALAGSDALAIESVAMFCSWFGALVGDLVVLFGAQGGTYLAGGVLPQIAPLLRLSDFAERLQDKGAMRSLLADLPVRLLDDDRFGLIGAAHWFVDNGGLEEQVQAQ